MSSALKMLHANGKRGEHPPSWYHATCDTPQYPMLSNDVDTDVCVIGAGYTGLSAALQLRQLGLSVSVLDAQRIAWGASGRNGGQLGSGFNMDQSELEARYGTQQAHALWRIAEQAKRTVHTLCEQHNINAHYQSGIIDAKHRLRLVNDAHRYCDKLAKQYNYDQLEPLSKNDLRKLVDSPNFHGGVLDHGAGHVHPLALATGIANAASKLGANLYELSEARSIERNTDGSLSVQTENGSVRAGNVVLACNGYLDGLEPQVTQRVMPINNFIVATEPLGDLADQLISGNHAVFDSRFVVNYFRLSADKRLLFGGGETYSYQFPKDIASLVRKPLSQVFPQLSDVRIDYAWGGTLAITHSRLPYVRQIKPNVYSASGYSGHGVALAIETGKAIADAIHGDNRTFDQLSALRCARFPGGSLARTALLKGAMSWYAMRDRF